MVLCSINLCGELDFSDSNRRYFHLVGPGGGPGFDAKGVVMKQLVVAISVFCLVLTGCAKPAEEPPAVEEDAVVVEWERVLPGLMTETQKAQQELVLTATNALVAEMMGELMAALDAGDASAAIGVCREKAPTVGAHVSDQYGVKIGRTSHKLRNPANVAPAWADPYVKELVADPTYLAGPNGEMGALLPIQLKADCQMCHGPAEMIDDDIRAAIAEHYPDDQAVGFADGELRGWFWIEAPPGEIDPATTEM